MIYINVEERYFPMIHAKFKNRRLSGSDEEDFQGIYSHGGHLGYVILTIYIDFRYPNDDPHKVWR